MHTSHPIRNNPKINCKKLTNHAHWTTRIVILTIMLLGTACVPLTPAPNVPAQTDLAPAAYPNPTTDQTQIYHRQGDFLEMKATLPESPAQANVYLALPDQHATLESAQALARRFDIEGQVYEVPGEIKGTTDYIVTAGGPQLHVRSDNYFSYDKNPGSLEMGAKDLTSEQVTRTLDNFMRSHGFEFEYKIEPGLYQSGLYYVVPQLDGLSLRYSHLMPVRLEILLSKDGEEVLNVFGELINTQLIGAYNIRSAEQAFQRILSETALGVVQYEPFSRLNETIWSRKYPDNKTITLYGQVRRLSPAQADQSPLFTLANFALSGHTDGMELVENTLLVEASGQFVTNNNSHIFRVDSWKPSNAAGVFMMYASPKMEGSQVMVAADNRSYYPLVNAPADLPMDTAQFSAITINGALVNGRVEWSQIRYFPNGLQGEGNNQGAQMNTDRGIGYYKLNLTGTPVPFPTSGPTPQAIGGEGTFYTVQAGDTLSKIAADFGVSVDMLMQANGFSGPEIYIGQVIVIPSATQSAQSNIGQKAENMRGLISVTIYKKPDGTQRAEIGFSTNSPNFSYGNYFLLEGNSLQDLQNYNNRPINIWGTLDRVENGQIFIKVDRYEVPFPDLQIQILKGTQKLATFKEQQVALFTEENGATYALVLSDGSPDSSIVGKEGDQVVMETLAVPDETFGGYPAIHIFTALLAVNPKNGQPVELTVSADQPYVTDEPLAAVPSQTATMTIEKVELIYYTTNLRYAVPDDIPEPAYIQPVWRFYGHYSDGGEFEFLVQALKDEFLSSEIQVTIKRK